MNLDRDYPQGNPRALYCRHCHCRRTAVRDGLFCATCDGNALAIAQQSDAA
jgi:hypothetical protein